MAAKPNDMTGRILKEAQEKHAEEAQEAAGRMAMATAQAEIQLETGIIDATEPNKPTVIVDEATVVGSPTDRTEVIRLLDDIENMTFGANNYYSFKAGQKYKVSVELANYLREKRYVAE
jgi:hypothetical protein